MSVTTLARPARSRPGPRQDARASVARHQETSSLFERASGEDLGFRQATLEEIVVLYVPMARGIAGRYRNRGCELEDLEQAACLALIKAVQGFDPGVGSDFMAYAVPSIRGAVRRYFRDFGWMVRPPRSVQELQLRVADERAAVDQGSGRPLTDAQVAQRLGTSAAAVAEARAALGCFVPTSLDAPMGETTDTVLGDLLRSEADPGYAASEARVLLEPALGTLESRDRGILQRRYVDGRSQQDIGNELGMSQTQVSRHLARIMAQLRLLLMPDEAAARW